MQALRLGLLAGQALERSDNPATMRRKGQLLRVGLSKSSAYSRLYMLINQTTKAHPRNSKPLALVFQGLRRRAFACF